METKQYFNELPRPTFRWLGVNHTEGAVTEKAAGVASALTWEGDVEVVAPLQNTALLKDSYTGANRDSLDAVVEKGVSYLIHVGAGESKTLLLKAAVSDEVASQAVRIRIWAEEKANVDVMYVLEGNTEKEGTFQLFTEVCGAEDSVVTIRKAQFLGGETQHIEHRYTKLADRATVNYLNIELGSKESFFHFENDLIGEKSRIEHDLAYLGHGKQKYDISMLMSHIGKQSESLIQNMGALTGEAKKSFRGTLDFIRGCTGSEGSEEDICLLLNEKVKSVSLPLLLCKEDNVVGNHAASAGQLDANKLFYIMSRGFSESEAKHILVESMLRPFIDKIENEEVEEKAVQLMEQYI